MNFDDVLSLVKAGFSKREIEAFTAESGENETVEVSTIEAAPVEVSTVEAAPVEEISAETPAAETTQPSWNDVMLAIKGLTEAVQAGNRHTVQMPAESSATVEDTLRAVSGIAATNKNHK